MTKDELWDHNVKIINDISIAAGSVIKQLLVDLETVDTYIKLGESGTHRVDYSVEEGQESLVLIIAEELGINAQFGELVVPGG